jgi:hypothetical protein
MQQILGRIQTSTAVPGRANGLGRELREALLPLLVVARHDFPLCFLENLS